MAQLMAWELVTIDGIALREAQTAGLDGDTLSLAGREMSDITSAAQVVAAHTNVAQLEGRTVPVVFGGKNHLSGFYRVESASSSLQRFAAGQLLIATWSARLKRLGTGQDVEFESLVPTVARNSEVAGAASFWHAPPGGTLDYFTGSTVPAASVSRTGSDGPIVVYRGIPAGVAPQWTVATADYLKGSARIVLDGIRRVGASTPPHAAWSISNSLVEVRSATAGTFEVAVVAADGTPKSVKGWVPSVNGGTTFARPDFTIIRNDPEQVTVRLSYASAPGRMTLDLSLRRGSRFVTGVIKRHSAAILGVARVAAETATSVTGGLRATNADADGNRYVIGSTRNVGKLTASAWITQANSTRLDFFVGHEVGASPAAGDAFADLFAQYLAMTKGEEVRARTR